jgi:hypothetical protein
MTDDEEEDDDDGDEIDRAAQVQTPKLAHQAAKAMIEQLMINGVEDNFPEAAIQGLQAYAKELDKRHINQPRSQSKLNSFFRPKPMHPPK